MVCPHCNHDAKVDPVIQEKSIAASSSSSNYELDVVLPSDSGKEADFFANIGLSQLDFHVPAITEPVPGSTLHAYPNDIKRRSVYGEPRDNIQPHNNSAPTEPQSEEKHDDEIDELFVTWDGPDDPMNPRNWSKAVKWGNVAVICIQALLCPMSSTILATCEIQIADAFNITSTYVTALPVALFVFGIGFGPVFFGPLSEVWGKRNMYVYGYWIFTLLNLASSWSPNMAVLAFLRFLCGIAGSAGPSLGGSSLGDMFSASDRGLAQATHTLISNIGPVFGAILGGVLLDTLNDWVWLPRVMSLFSLVAAIVSTIMLRETYAPVLLERKAAKIRKETGNDGYYSRTAVALSSRLYEAGIRPMKFLCTVPISAVMTLYSATIFGIYYLYLTTTPLLFGPEPKYGLFTYGWAFEYVGLAYLSGFVGGLGAMILVLFVAKKMYVGLSKRFGNGVGQPEFRMPFLQIGICMVPFGLFAFAWTAESEVSWIWPSIGNAITCCAILICHAMIQTYMVDTFENHSATALAALAMGRAVVGTIFSLVGFNLFATLGYGWGGSLLAFIALLAVPIPTILFFYGPRLRASYKTKF